MLVKFLAQRDNQSGHTQDRTYTHRHILAMYTQRHTHYAYMHTQINKVSCAYELPSCSLLNNDLSGYLANVSVTVFHRYMMQVSTLQCRQQKMRTR